MAVKSQEKRLNREGKGEGLGILLPVGVAGPGVGTAAAAAAAATAAGPPAADRPRQDGAHDHRRR